VRGAVEAGYGGAGPEGREKERNLRIQDQVGHGKPSKGKYKLKYVAKI